MSCVSLLKEGWRLNDQLCRFPARVIYHQRSHDDAEPLLYQPANEKIAQRRFLALKRSPTLPSELVFSKAPATPPLRLRSPLLQLVADPDRSLCVVLLKTSRLPQPLASDSSSSSSSPASRFPHSPVIAGLIHFIRKLYTSVFR